MLTSDEIDRFERHGFTAVRGALVPELVAACMEIVSGEISKQGVDLCDWSTCYPLPRLGQRTPTVPPWAASRPAIPRTPWLGTK